MGIRSFRMFAPRPPPQFRRLRSQEPVLCHQAWRGRVTSIPLLDHQVPLTAQPDKNRTPPRSSPPCPGISCLLSAHSTERGRSPVRSRSPGQSLPRPTDTQNSALASTAKSTSAHSRLVSAPVRHSSAPCSSQSERASLADA